MATSDDTASAKSRAEELRHLAEVERNLYGLKKMHPQFVWEALGSDASPEHVRQWRKLSNEHHDCIRRLEGLGVSRKDSEKYADDVRKQADEDSSLELHRLAGLTTATAGELIAEGQKKGEIAVQGDGRPPKVSSQTTLIPAKGKPRTLDEIGVSRDQASQWKELAGIPDQAGSPARTTRGSGTVESRTAVIKMLDHLKSKGLGLTEFAGQIGITDRTLRSFRKTGKVRRDTFKSIAKGMGISVEELLKPE